MKKIILALAVSLLFACTQHETAPPPTTTSSEQVGLMGLASNDGAAVAATLNARYAQTTRNCFNSETAPIFLCSGIVIRATTYGDGYNVWDPSPNNVSNGFVAFSYMRNDAKSPALYNHSNNGYIARPVSAAIPGQIKLQYTCFFPIDGATDGRADKGCGQHILHGAISRFCSLQGITTANQFVAHYMANTSAREQKQCSWDVRDNSPYQTAALFREALATMPRIPKNGRNDENELVSAVWAKQPAANMPIEAFFYTDAAGLIQAKKNQSSYYAQANSIIVPVIKLTINSTSWAASFSYNPADQNYL
ncbi:hypothetical protein DLD99_25240 [Pseudomonas kribbensis]|uniref:Halovibrin HvnA n=1 Tax=Pseudomonas kribbensis TaxID=1628086 RepID=A0A345RWH3_9PSED|nr:hypothetical protein [Pseudomonas kribbensis]AXI63639.1 hypothetical protein DLD99_25240 [Pseudomonas kribbensis]